MTRQALFQAIGDGSFERVYFFHGPEEWVKESALARLREKLLPQGLEELNENVMEGGTAQAIIEAAETLPVMAEKRLVVVRDFPPLISGKARSEQEEAQRLIDWLPTAPDSAAVVFYVRGAADMRKKLSSALSKLPGAVSFDPLDDAELLKWANARLKKLGKRMDRAALDSLTFLAGRSLTRLDGEISKLAAFAGARDVITPEDVERLVPPSLESSVFQMIDFLMDGKIYDAHRLYGALIRAGENRVGILAMLTRQMRMLTHIRRLRAQGAPLKEIEEKLSLNHFAATRAQAQAARLTEGELEDMYRACAEADYDIKRGAVRDQAAVDALMLRLGRKKG
jgi:DNA polymerase-3 subunit delta